MPVIYQAYISRQDVQANPDKLYVFGDNMLREGLGGQAKAMRGEPNSIGIPTKRLPSQMPNSFFSDLDLENPEVKSAIDRAFVVLEAFLMEKGTVVIPSCGVGSGLAELPTRAPKLDAYIKSRFQQLETL